MDKKLSFKVIDIAYEAFDESIWEVSINGLDLKVRVGDNCLTTEDHLKLKGGTFDAPLSLEFVQVETASQKSPAFEIQDRPVHLRSGADVLIRGKVAAICSEELVLIESLVPIYLHIEGPFPWKVGDSIQARGLLCLVLEES